MHAAPGMRRLLLALLLLGCHRFDAESQATPIPRFAGEPDSSKRRHIGGMNYDPVDKPLAWPRAETLLVAHAEHYSSADVVSSTCGGSGIFAVPLSPGA